MAVIRVIHWRATESAPLIEACRNAGSEVEYLAGDGGAVGRAIRAKLPDIVVIDLSRLPAHGREVALWLRRTKRSRAVPIIFVGGDADKVTPIRRLLPDAQYCQIDELSAAIKRLSKSPRKGNPPTPPATPLPISERSAAQKLGISNTVPAMVAVIDPPRNFPQLLGEVPASIDFTEGPAPMTLWFIHDRESFLDSLRRMRTIAAQTKLWLLWRKGSSGDGLTQNVVRDTMREVGLVDYKICSVDERWSAMLFTRRKS